MDTNTVLKQFAAEGLQVNLIHFNQTYMGPKVWHLDLSNDDGMAFKLSTQATSLEGVVELAWQRWQALRDRGLLAAMTIQVALSPPNPLESRAASPDDEDEFKDAMQYSSNENSLDDEIPF